MKIIRAEHLGMCFGVRDAIALAVATAGHEPLTILGDLVHNETVLAELRAKGIRIEQQSANVRHADGDDHGARRIRTRAEQSPPARIERAGSDLSARPCRSIAV